MGIKSFIITVSAILGLFISMFTAFMTFFIINEPIGYTMFFEISMVVVLMLPVILIVSVLIGKYLAKKFELIQKRLKMIERENFAMDESSHLIHEINGINESMNVVSHRLDGLINDLKQKNKNLSNLLVSLAHDVKTPLTILHGYVEEIEDGLIEQDALPKALTQMKDELNFLNDLTVDTLHYISSMQSSREQEKINLHDFIVKDVFAILPVQKDVEYINAIDENLMIEFNRLDLQKVCMNILSNAIRYTKEGYIKVQSIEGLVYFENSGDIIDEKYKDDIFEPFFTISESKNRKQSGFGLGLSIVRQLCGSNGYSCYLSQTYPTAFCLQMDR